jgi:hypothetical protein
MTTTTAWSAAGETLLGVGAHLLEEIAELEQRTDQS